MVSLGERASGAGGSAAKEQIKEVLDKFDALLRQTRFDTVTQLTFALFMGLWPLLQASSSYFLPVAWLLGIPIAYKGVYANMPVTKATTSSGGGVNGAAVHHGPSGHSTSGTGHSSFRSTAAALPLSNAHAIASQQETHAD